MRTRVFLSQGVVVDGNPRVFRAERDIALSGPQQQARQFSVRLRFAGDRDEDESDRNATV
jgi:hypothetical protein